MDKFNFNELKDKDIYSILNERLNKAFTVEEETVDINDGLSGMEYWKAVLKSFISQNRKTIIVGISYFILVINFLALIICFILSVVRLNTRYAASNIIYFSISMILPFACWVISTRYDFWSFHDRKIKMLRFCFANFGILLANINAKIIGSILMPFFVNLAMSQTQEVSLSMIKSLARFTMLISCSIVPIAIFIALVKTTNNPITYENIVRFKLTKLIDFRSKEEKEFAYDMDIVRNLKTGKKHIIKEKDRYLHALCNGVTGTGKTSSTFTCQIESDIEQISYNMEYQKKMVQKYLDEGLIRMKKPMKDIDYSIENFEVIDNEKNKDLLTKLKYKAKIAGITAMAPNASFSDDIYGLAKAKGLKVNRLDPILGANGKMKEGFVGFNPLYINPKLDIFDWHIEVIQKAVLLADVTQAVFDASGQSDVYFAGLNRNITTTVTIMILLTFPFMKGKEGKQPTIRDVQDVLHDFDKATPYLTVMEEKYAKKPINRMKPDLGQFQPIYDVVKHDMLGDGKQQLFDQCRGLRNIIDSTMQNPMIRNILCYEKSMDLDAALENGEITLVNYALELGADSTVFGLFFLLSLISAAYRRKGNENTRIPNFIYIDELSVLLHSRLEQCFTLFRQYRMAMFVAIQSLSQMEKSPSTAFLKQVLLGNCSHHFVFGRAAAEEMKMYQDLAGTSNQIVEMEGVTETSLYSDNPTRSYNRRSSLQLKNNVEASQIRYRDFQEVTVVTVDNGSPVDMFAGKVSFLPEFRKLKKKRYCVDWDIYITNNSSKEEPDSKRPEDQGAKKTEIHNKIEKLKVTNAEDIYTESDSKEPDKQETQKTELSSRIEKLKVVSGEDIYTESDRQIADIPAFIKQKEAQKGTDDNEKQDTENQASEYISPGQTVDTERQAKQEEISYSQDIEEIEDDEIIEDEEIFDDEVGSEVENESYNETELVPEINDSNEPAQTNRNIPESDQDNQSINNTKIKEKQAEDTIKIKDLTSKFKIQE